MDDRVEPNERQGDLAQPQNPCYSTIPASRVCKTSEDEFGIILFGGGQDDHTQDETPKYGPKDCHTESAKYCAYFIRGSYALPRSNAQGYGTRICSAR